MLSVREIHSVFNALYQLNLGYRLGYAGSYARGQAEENSDLDIVVKGEHEISGEDYFKLYNTLKNVLAIPFDIVDLVALKEDDDKMDKMLIDMGLESNYCSAYKTMKKEAVWMCE